MSANFAKGFAKDRLMAQDRSVPTASQGREELIVGNSTNALPAGNVAKNTSSVVGITAHHVGQDGGADEPLPPDGML